LAGTEAHAASLFLAVVPRNRVAVAEKVMMSVRVRANEAYIALFAPSHKHNPFSFDD